MNNTQTIPTHIAIIMDGNRRWAREHKMEAFKGHEYVANKIIEELTEACIEQGVKYLTLWAFSTENWNREQKEVDALMNLFRQSFKKNAKNLHEKGVRLNVIGDISRFPSDIQENIASWLEASKNNTRITVTFALNYGGRDEIIRAVNRLLEDVVNGSPGHWDNDRFKNLETQKPIDQANKLHSYLEVDQELFIKYLDTKDIPDPDLIIRPGGEKRLSGYLPWQSTYSELYFTDTLMPDFGSGELQLALEEYAGRQRRFGR